MRVGGLLRAFVAELLDREDGASKRKYVAILVAVGPPYGPVADRLLGRVLVGVDHLLPRLRD